MVFYYGVKHFGCVPAGWDKWVGLVPPYGDPVAFAQQVRVAWGRGRVALLYASEEVPLCVSEVPCVRGGVWF